MQITEEQIEQLRNLDIVDVVGRYADLKKQGANYTCKCPLPTHDEKTASFTVSPTKNIYKCFGCGEAGDTISFIQKVEQVDFVEACKILASMSNIMLDNDQDKTQKQKFSKSKTPNNLVSTRKTVVKSILSNDKSKNDKEYRKPKTSSYNPSNELLDYFKSRGISKNTVGLMQVKQSKKYFSKEGKELESINFNYYKNNEVVNVKYRSLASKQFGLESGCELLLYNIDNITDDDSVLYITEGEFDALALVETYCNLDNFTSVPNGASSGRAQNIDYLNNKITREKIGNTRKLALLFDDDPAGKLLTDAYIKRFGEERCLIPTYPSGCKDLNEVLVKHTTKGVVQVIETLTHPFVDGLANVFDFEHIVDNYYENGYPNVDKVGFKELDKLIGFRRGELTMVTGIPGSGKSEVLDEIIIRLSELHEWKTAICSLENPPELHIIKLLEKYNKKPFRDIVNKETGEIIHSSMNEGELIKGKIFLNKNFTFIRPKKLRDEKGVLHRSVLDLDYILTQAKKVVSMCGLDALVIDPWNTIEHVLQNGETESNYIGRVLSKITAFAEDYNIHVFLVAHPTKGVTFNGKDRVATLYDIAGSANFFNKTHNGLSIFRVKDKELNPTNTIEIHVQKIKFKFVGNLGKCYLNYDLITGCYSDCDQTPFYAINEQKD